MPCVITVVARATGPEVHNNNNNIYYYVCAYYVTITYVRVIRLYLTLCHAHSILSSHHKYPVIIMAAESSVEYRTLLRLTGYMELTVKDHLIDIRAKLVESELITPAQYKEI